MTNFNETAPYAIAEGVVARRNQDGTIILMKVNDVRLFYKVDGLASTVWTELQKPKTLQGLSQHFETLAPQSGAWSENIAALMTKLLSIGMIEEKPEAAGLPQTYVATTTPDKKEFGGVREFNLEQIETEVLNESIYLDVFAGSDMNLKTEIKPLEGALAKINQLEGVQFLWNSENAPKGIQTGVIAQQVAEQMPELVRRDETSGHLAVNYQKMNAYLIEAVKELTARVQELEKRG